MIKDKIAAIKKMLKQIYYVLEPKHRRKLPRLFVCILVSSVFELLGVTAVLPFVYALVDTDVVMNNKYAKPIFEFFDITDALSVLKFLGLAIVVLYFVKNLVLFLSSWYQIQFSTRIQKELSIKMLKAYLSRPYEFFLDCTAGEIGRGCTQDAGSIFGSIQIIFGLLMSLFTSVLIGTYMIISDPTIAIGTLLVAIGAVLIMTKIIKPTMKRYSTEVMYAAKKQSDAFNQTVFGIKELYVMGRKDMFLSSYDEASEEMRKISVRMSTVEMIPNRMIETLFVGGFMIIVLFRLSLGGMPSTYVPKLASFAMGAFKVLPYISGVTNKINGLVFNKKFVNNIYKNIKAAELYAQKMKEYASETGMSSEEEELHFEQELIVKNVLWKYSKAKEPVLTDANLVVKKGEAIGLIGPSGSGKTTLSDIILGLLEPQSGSVYMDGNDIFSIPKAWPRIVGYVPQSVFLTAGTFRDNVAFGLKDFSDEWIWESLEKAQLGEFVRSLPKGLDTEVGERGIKLSGGQRQRVAIARALANRPEILVLDEATAALDNETEKAIMESIDSLQGQITMIIVAHRLTTIKKCDRIYRIQDGKATQVSHEEVFS